MSTVHRIVEEVAQREGVGPMNIEPAPHDVVDIDAPEAFSTEAEHRSVGQHLSVAFLYHGYSVTVDGDSCVMSTTEPN